MGCGPNDATGSICQTRVNKKMMTEDVIAFKVFGAGGIRLISVFLIHFFHPRLSRALFVSVDFTFRAFSLCSLPTDNPQGILSVLHNPFFSRFSIKVPLFIPPSTQTCLSTDGEETHTHTHTECIRI